MATIPNTAMTWFKWGINSEGASIEAVRMMNSGELFKWGINSEGASIDGLSGGWLHRLSGVSIPRVLQYWVYGARLHFV